MNPERHDVDVLICGAGAAGLTLAVELARRGVDFRIIDRAHGPFQGSRGRGIQPRTMEIFEDLGVLDAIAAAGGPYPPKRVHRPDGGHADVALVEPQRPTPAEPYGMPIMAAQFATEAALRARLFELGHRVDYGVALDGFEQDAQRVCIQLRGPQGAYTVTARYLVGADGGRSTVRHALNVGFPGTALGQGAVVADVELPGLARDAWHSFNEDTLDRLLALCPLMGTDLFSLMAPLAPDSAFDATVDGLNTLIAARTGRRDIHVTSIAWASVFQMSARLADRYRVGRVFLAGDAAHVHPPTGAQGLNTSVQDAYNLGWKLAGALAADGPGDGAALLDSYEAERRPIGAAMLALSTALLDAARRGDFRRGRDVRQLDLAYPNSPLALAAGQIDARIRAGARAPDAPVRGAAGQPVRLFQLFQGSHWTLLLRRDGAGADLGALARPGLRVHVVGDGGDLHDDAAHLHAAYGLAPGQAVLVRPDGYIGMLAHTTAPDAMAALLDYMRAFIGC